MLQNSSDLSTLYRDSAKPRHKEQPMNQTQRLQSHLQDDVDNQTTFKSKQESTIRLPKMKQTQNMRGTDNITFIARIR